MLPMAEAAIHAFSNKIFRRSDGEIIAKAVEILAAIEGCGCDHCKKLLGGLHNK